MMATAKAEGSRPPSASPDSPDIDSFDGAGEGTTAAKSSREKRHPNQAPAKKARSEKTRVKKQRFTSDRSKADKQVLKPGGTEGKSYVKLYELEAKCAAYCGFKDVAELRIFALSPYALTFVNLLHPVRNLAQRSDALQLLKDIQDFKGS